MSEKEKSASLLANSARGASFLVFLQIASRALTFIVNQVLLRYLSPQLLGISSQLELYTISVLYFSRESLRVALQRLGRDENDVRASARRAQEAVNLSYTAIALGPPLAFAFARFYLRRATPAVMAIPYFEDSLNLYAVATIIELCVEPCFVVAQLQMLYGLRASAETVATIARCILTCGSAIWASRNERPIGALPFAFGQLGYALTLNLFYFARLWPQSRGFSLTPRWIKAKESVLALFPSSILYLALNLYAQSSLKHILTQGDSLLIALFTSLTSQGIYALASNYGSLLARLLFQPIEESSRSLFGRLLSSSSPAPMENDTIPTNVKAYSSSSLLLAYNYLFLLLRTYSLLSLLLVTILPTLFPLLLRTLLGPVWASTAAPHVLSLYSYYLPLLAINGILEAFVSAVATPQQLRVQSAWMVAFSAGFAAAGWMILGIWGWGAEGLVLANGVNMGIRIWWGKRFVEGWFGERETRLRIIEASPGWGTLAVGVGAVAVLKRLEGGFDGSVLDLGKVLVAGGVYGLLVLYLERSLLLEIYRTFRPLETTKGKT